MAILSTASIQRQRKTALADGLRGGRRERREAGAVARRVASLMGRLAAPRLGDAPDGWGDGLDGIPAERLVLVYTDEPPVELLLPTLDATAPPEVFKNPAATATEVQAYFAALLAGSPLAPDADPLGVPVAYEPEADTPTLSPVLDERECYLAAYRALMASAADHGGVQTWSVTTWSSEKGNWECRLYTGTEAALRRTFPDWQEQLTRDAAGVEELHDEPSVPFRIRRHS